MSFARQVLSLSALAGLAFLSVCQLAQAADCDAYASDAVAAMRFSRENNCGFMGDAWSDNFDGHKKWCLGAPPQDVQRETDIRNRMVWACQNVANDCIAYSEVAVAQQWANKNVLGNIRNCEGPAWNDDRMAHEHWCLRAPPEQRRNETLLRTMRLRDGC